MDSIIAVSDTGHWRCRWYLLVVDTMDSITANSGTGYWKCKRYLVAVDSRIASLLPVILDTGDVDSTLSWWTQ